MKTNQASSTVPFSGAVYGTHAAYLQAFEIVAIERQPILLDHRHPRLYSLVSLRLGKGELGLKEGEGGGSFHIAESAWQQCKQTTLEVLVEGGEPSLHNGKHMWRAAQQMTLPVVWIPRRSQACITCSPSYKCSWWASFHMHGHRPAVALVPTVVRTHGSMHTY
jgi:hypothetical protein